jgi:tRNA A37 N6-isopentenylltransferase MiaA
MTARTRALARRQMTWMRKLPRAALVSAAGRTADAVAAEVLSLLEAPAW